MLARGWWSIPVLVALFVVVIVTGSLFAWGVLVGFILGFIAWQLWEVRRDRRRLAELDERIEQFLRRNER